MPRRTVMKGALALLIAGLISRAMGMVFRVVLVRQLGEAGMGLFQLMVPVFGLGYTLATLGLPAAMPQAIAKALARGDKREAAWIRRIGLGMMLVAAAVVGIMIYVLAPWIAGTVLSEPRVALVLRVVPLLLLPTVICAALRASFEGEQAMVPGAVAQVMEPLIRVPVVLLLVPPLVVLGTEMGTVGVVAGMFLGETAALVILASWRLVRRRRFRLQEPQPPGQRRVSPARPLWSQRLIARRASTKALLTLSAPILLTGLLNSLMKGANAAIIPRRLAMAGHTQAEATALYGELTGMVMPLLFMPLMAVYPLAHTLVPAISHRMARRSKGTGLLIFQAYGITLALGLVAGLTFYFFPTQLARIFGSGKITPMVQMLAYAAPVVYLEVICTAILHGMGQTAVVFRNSLVGNAVRIAMVYNLAARPGVGIMGAFWAVVADFAVTAGLNTVAIVKSLRAAAK